MSKDSGLLPRAFPIRCRYDIAVGPFDWLYLATGVALQVLVLSVMLRGPWREYPFVFLYVIASALSTAIQTSCKYYFGPHSKEFVRAYWTTDFISTFLILLLIIHLIRRAMEGRPKRGTVYAGLRLGLVILAVGMLFYMQHSLRHFSLGWWMTRLGRDYYFMAMLLNAVLWFTLLKVNHPDRRLYLVTSGMGLALSGAAIAHALRTVGQLVVVAGLLLVITYFGKLYIWYVALRPIKAVASGQWPVAGGKPVSSGQWPVASKTRDP